jgi:enterochelin esterase family protein
MTCPSRHVLATVVWLACAASAASAQQPPVRSPEVHAGGRVTVRLRAPNAREVLFAREGAPPAPMTRDTAGDWSHTTEALAPDIYGYTFRVDGVAIPDPQNPEMKPVFRMSLGQSLLHVPGPDSLSWELRDVPHGAITEHFYTSGIIGDRRNYYVYTPPNYDARRAEPYPVLYLLHGLSDDASGWVRAGRANVILDNLIADRRAAPMLVVMTLGYGAPEMLDGFYWGRQIDSALWRRNTTHFADALLKEVIPQVEGWYHAARTPARRAIAGLSMGGGQSLYIGLNNPDRFAYIGAFSSVTAMNRDAYETTYSAAHRGMDNRLQLLWIGIGREDFLYAENVRFRDWLRARSVRFEWVETAGGHTWMIWRRYLTDFLPRLFR